MNVRWQKVAGLSFVGATMGTLFDFLHVTTGAVAYEHPNALGMAWWVPLLYVGAALSIGLSHPELDRWLDRRDRFPLTPLRIAGAMLSFMAIWFATGAIPLPSIVVAAILAPASVAVWWFFDRTRGGVVLAIATGAGGVLAEATLIRLGAFHHRNPDMLGVAYWLPCIYAAGSVAVGNLGRRLSVPGNEALESYPPKMESPALKNG